MGEAEKKKEAALAEKRKLFEKDPNMFVDKRELLLAARVLSDGHIQVLIGDGGIEKEYAHALFKIQRLVYNIFNNKDAIAHRNKPGLYVPDNPEEIIGGK